ncbi:MAG TPA: hypothetical protein DCY13_13765 [Verrucomicrobiales bacterium]|nr:hypothetical protein [Verrucomicrobiales bacterium]
MIDRDKKQAAGLEPMEMMGALTVRLIHDLTNQLTVLAGNAQVLEMVRNNPERLAKVVDRIRNSSAAAGELLDRFSQYRQQLVYRTKPHPLEQCLRELEALNPSPGQWRVSTIGDLGALIALEPRWVAFAVWQTVLQSGVGAGEVRVSRGGFPADWSAAGHVPARLKQRQLLRCELAWSSPGPWLDEHEAAKPMNLHLAVVYELTKIVDGWVHYQFLPGDQHRFNLFLPLFGSEN